jgi:phage tail sheath protein FI
VRRLLLFAVTASALFAADPLADSAQKKLDSISDQKLKPGSVVTLSPREVNAWIHEKAVKAFPEGVRNEHIDLGPGTADGNALVDLTKIGKSKNSVNPLIARLIEGERPLRVAIRVESANGRATVFLTHVELSGVAIDGSILDFLIKHFVQPRYPDIKINEPIELDFNIERIEIQPMGVRILIKK